MYDTIPEHSPYAQLHTMFRFRTASWFPLSFSFNQFWSRYISSFSACWKTIPHVFLPQVYNPSAHGFESQCRQIRSPFQHPPQVPPKPWKDGRMNTSVIKWGCLILVMNHLARYFKIGYCWQSINRLCPRIVFTNYWHCSAREKMTANHQLNHDALLLEGSTNS